jgi:hypothetical protein
MANFSGSIPSCSNTATSSVSASVVLVIVVVDDRSGAATDRLVVVNASTNGAKRQTIVRARVLQIMLMTMMLLMEPERKTQQGDLVSHG